MSRFKIVDKETGLKASFEMQDGQALATAGQLVCLCGHAAARRQLDRLDLVFRYLSRMRRRQ